MNQILQFACGAEGDIEKAGELRAHGLIKKVPRSHRYLVTDKGRSVIGALLAARNASVHQLAKLAA